MGPEHTLFLSGVCTSVSPEIVQVGDVKGLNSVESPALLSILPRLLVGVHQ